jgi:membrane protein DedA with SNARE-associated domain
MITYLIEIIASFILATISSSGYLGIILLMAIESACIPLPSEIIMPFSGYLVFRGDFRLFWVGLAGGFGCVVGSALAYYLGLYGGRPLVERYGKYVLIFHRDLDLADRWFNHYGDWAIFFSRLLPVLRTFISFPAGVARMNFPRFVVYTFLGSFPWCLGLAYIGMKLGQNWDTLRVYFHRFDMVVGALIALGVIYYLWHHLKRRRESAGAGKELE